MTEITPEKLREWVEAWNPANIRPTFWVRDMLEGIASAWEADRKRIEALEKENGETFRMRADRNRGYAMFYRKKCIELRQLLDKRRL